MFKNPPTRFIHLALLMFFVFSASVGSVSASETDQIDVAATKEAMVTPV
jgi:hypothetical protein